MRSLRRIFREFLRFLCRSRRTLLLIAIVAAITVIVNVLIAVWLSRSYNLEIPSLGTISVTGTEAYGGDLKTVNGVAYIDWGLVQWGDSRNVSFFLRNTGSVPTRLGLNVTDCNPEGMKNYATLTWDYNGAQLAPKQEITVRLALSMPGTRDFADYLVSNGVSSYNFTLYIYALK